MFPTYVDSSCHVENAFILRWFSSWLIDVDFYFVELLLFNIAVQKQGSVIFVVVGNWTKLCLLLFRCLGQFFEVSYQIFKLRHLDELLYDVARIEMADGLDVLEHRLIILLHLVELVCVVLWNLSDDIWWEFGLIGNIFSINKKSLFQKRVDLDVVFHLIQLAQHYLVVRVDCQVINGILLYLYLQNSAVRSCPVARNSILQIVNLELARCFFLGILCARSSWLKVDWHYVISEVADALLFILFYVVHWRFLGKSKKTNQVRFFARIFLTSRHSQCICVVVEISASSF